jgi:uncharacterized protein (DUF1015 family)
LADIRPFHGLHYNPALVKDLANVICPPYDIISPQFQQQLYERNEYNFVRVEYGREFPQDKDTDNKYTRASATLSKWIEQGVLKADKTPSIYIEDHHFPHDRKLYRRRSINCIVRLEEWDKMVVRPHEGTLSQAKGDRLNLLWALQANTSPIMTLYEDQENQITSLLDAKTRGNPFLSSSDDNKEKHLLWAIDDDETISQICRLMSDQPLYIADGHHRYESALTYKRERQACDTSTSENEPYNFVMMTLVSFNDPGLVILPAHRLLRGLPPSALHGLVTGLATCFKIEEHTLNKANPARQIDELLSEGPGEVNLVMYGLKEEILLRLCLKEFDVIKPMMPYFHSETYQKLDVSIVDHVILEELLGLSHDTAGAYLDYTSNVLDAINKVREKEYQVAFIVNPVKPEVIKAIADSGDRMPKKSTYFYPKIPAGLVFYSFK